MAGDRWFHRPGQAYKAAGMTELAIYDMDRTITRRATYTPFLLHSVRRRAPWRLVLLPLVLLSMLAYACRLVDRGRLKEINHALLLGRHNRPEELALVAGSFADETLRTNILPGALAQIAADKAAGRRLVMATASYRLYAAAIAERLGFDDVIATNSVAGLDGRIRARIDGENSYGPAKLRMILAWMATAGLRREDCRVWFYSDHASDAPVFEWSDVAVAANPSRDLREMAGVRGWPVVEWGA